MSDLERRAREAAATCWRLPVGLPNEATRRALLGLTEVYQARAADAGESGLVAMLEQLIRAAPIIAALSEPAQEPCDLCGGAGVNHASQLWPGRAICRACGGTGRVEEPAQATCKQSLPVRLDRPCGTGCDNPDCCEVRCLGPIAARTAPPAEEKA